MQPRIIDGDETASGDFWIVVPTEAKTIDHQSPMSLTTFYPSMYDTEQEACEAALQLAGKHKGYSFAVLKSQAIAKWRCDNTKCSESPDFCRRGAPCAGRVKWEECDGR